MWFWYYCNLPNEIEWFIVGYLGWNIELKMVSWFYKIREIDGTTFTSSSAESCSWHLEGIIIVPSSILKEWIIIYIIRNKYFKELFYKQHAESVYFLCCLFVPGILIYKFMYWLVYFSAACFNKGEAFKAAQEEASNWFVVFWYEAEGNGTSRTTSKRTSD